MYGQQRDLIVFGIAKTVSATSFGEMSLADGTTVDGTEVGIGVVGIVPIIYMMSLSTHVFLFHPQGYP